MPLDAFVELMKKEAHPAVLAVGRSGKAARTDLRTGGPPPAPDSGERGARFLR